MAFDPIAIVGQACVLPDALSPRELWDNVIARRDSVSRAPEGRWGLPLGLAVGAGGAREDRALSDAGGYVRGFEARFDPRGFLIPEEEIAALDTLFLWVLHTAREAARAIGHERASDRAGIIIGNLSFPAVRMARFAEATWLDAQGARFVGADARALAGIERAHARNRFMSGLPAHIAARALGLGACAMALDAACASSLYAIKLACDRLHDRTADVMLAGAVNGADDLALHAGFTALAALSPSGRSRPFHREADGLVPAQGAAIVALKRLDDALAAGDRVLGVIRGVGLSNDGRGRGLLVPSEEGQERAMREAYAIAGVSPLDVGLVECHATGTVVGDAAEVRSTTRVFQGARDVPIGSLKSNVGHLITAAGAAGLMKVLAAMEAGVRPPALHTEAPTAALSGTPLRLLSAAEPWDGPRRAGVSAFGFGGNNAHLIVEAFDGARDFARAQDRPRARTPVAIVGVGARAGQGDGAGDFARALFAGEAHREPRASIAIQLEGLRFPPRDLERTLAQQLLVLECAREVAARVTLPLERTSVLVGMGCDPEIARYGARWRVASWARTWAAQAGQALDPAWVDALRDAFAEPLEAAAVLGTMPNIPANRVNSQLDARGPSFTISSEEASGLAALEIAARALRESEIDAALVGASDLSHEPVHVAALAALGVDVEPGDAAVVLALKRLDDAKRDGDRVLAVLDEDARGVAFGDAPGAVQASAVFGRAHTAVGLLEVAAAATSIAHGALPNADRPASPWLGDRAATLSITPLEGIASRAHLRAGGPALPFLAEPPPRLHVFSAADRDGVLAALEARRESRDGPARLAIVASSPEELARRAAEAKRFVQSGGPAPEGVAYRARPIEGELAFVFAGAAAAYRGMGRELALALPASVAALAERSAEAAAATRWIFDRDGAPTMPLDQLWGASFLCQLHAEVSTRLLRVSPQAAIGYSSGESNSLFALGAWSDLDGMIRKSRDGGLFTREIGGDFAAVKRAWSKRGSSGTTWASYAVRASAESARAALEGEPLAHLIAVNAPDEVVVGGESAACDRVVARLGRDRAVPLGYDIAAHCPEVEEIREPWWQLHHRPTHPVPGVRFYTNATSSSYTPTPESAADAITGQAVTTLDFVRTIERAHEGGVRIFVEHGPRGVCTGWIRRILGDREHLAIALDVAGRSPIRQLANAVAELCAAGVAVDDAALFDHLASAAPAPPATGARLTIAAHPPPIHLPPLPAPMQTMPPAPPLVPVLESPVAAPSAPVTPPPVAAAPPPVVSQPAPFAPRPVAPQPVHLVPQPVGVTSLPVAPHALRAPVADILDRAARQHADMAAIHQAFIAQQSAAHARFLEVQHRALDAFTRTLVTGGAPPPMTLPVTAAPVALPPPAPAPLPVAAAAPPVAVAPPPVARRPVPAPQPPAVAASAAPEPPPATPAKPGPKIDRRGLEVLASGRISSVFGPLFEPQDAYRRQVRMPEPPLLLADRVTGIDAIPGSMGTGTLWTETDVRADSWYLNDEGRMPAGILIESGQADLLLISWLGVDNLNKGERVYRLLGCEMVFHGELPKAGQTLRYSIHVDGHATQGDVRLFFFHYDCEVDGRPQITVRRGQAGFFTDEELAASGGILWDAATDDRRLQGPCDPPLRLSEKRSLDAEELRAFAAGRPADCFGRGFELTRAHVRSPRVSSGDMLLLHRVTDIDPQGGPWKRGYLRAEADVSPDDWFFAGHFKNDPCMPGTLMLEGSLQAMAVYLAALGFTLDKDGARFEPVPEEKYTVSCRGQVTPRSKRVVYEIFVEELRGGPTPTLFADMLGTVDGLKAFHARRVGLRLVPDWPLERWRSLGPRREQETGEPVPLSTLGGIAGYVEPRAVAAVDGFRFDYASLLACAWGVPSAAFGPMYARFDGSRRVPRLPGPPYHFMSRVTSIRGAIGGMEVKSGVVVEYDIPDRAWYFEQNSAPFMPFCVLLEAALQPCGWLASYVGSTLVDGDVLFRNLDGTGVVEAEIGPGAGTLRTEVELVSISRSAGMTLESFSVACFIGDKRVFHTKTGFGFFPPEAFVDQVGLPPSDAERARLEAPGDAIIDLSARPARYFGGPLSLPGPMLLMINRVTGAWPDGGRAGLGALRAEKDVDPGEWFFKAHFFQDPVQPGSLGIEALIQALMALAIDRGLGEGIQNPRFEPILTGQQVTWRYRGQVVPKNARVTAQIEATRAGEDERGRFLIAEGWLWVDGKRIYHVKDLGIRVVPGAPHAGAASGPTGATPIGDLARRYWRNALGVGAWPAEDLYVSVLDRFLGRLSMVDAPAVERLRGKSCLFLANHQVAVESLLFTLIAPAIIGTPVSALAKAEHRDTWMGHLVNLTFSYPGVADPGLLAFIDRADPGALLRFLETSAGELKASPRGLLVHVEGTRSLSSRDRVTRVSSALIDLAIGAGVPIVPVRFTGALPPDPLDQRLDFPLGYARQDITLGAPILPETLAALPYRERVQRVCDAINQLGPGEDVTAPPDPSFAMAVSKWARDTGASHEASVLFTALTAATAPCDATRALLAGAAAGSLQVGAAPEQQWLGRLARFLFGPRGPEVRGLADF